MKAHPKPPFPLALLLSALTLNLELSHDAHAASFSYTGSLGGDRAFHSAILLPNAKVLVAGGWASDALASAELYDPSEGTWSATGSLLIGRLHHKATLLPNGKILVAAGWNGFNTLASAELYDPDTEVWTQTGSLMTARYQNTMTLIANGHVLVAGGLATGTGNPLASAELYDPATGQWTETGSMSTNRVVQNATLLPNGKVLVTGGGNGSGATFSSAELYDPASGTWTPTGSMTTNRVAYTATLLANGLVLVAGGASTPRQPGATALSTAELYDPATGTWKLTGGLSGPRAGHNARLLPNGQVLVTGGAAIGYGSSLATAELYDPNTGTWTTTGPMNQGRENFTATLLPDGNVLIAGGGYWVGDINNYVYVSSAELYDSSAGSITLINPVKQPGGSLQFAFTGVPNGTNTVLTTTDLALPLADWTVLGIVPEFSPGLYLFTDPQATTDPQRFYRLLSP